MCDVGEDDIATKHPAKKARNSHAACNGTRMPNALLGNIQGVYKPGARRLDAGGGCWWMDAGG